MKNTKQRISILFMSIIACFCMFIFTACGVKDDEMNTAINDAVTPVAEKVTTLETEIDSLNELLTESNENIENLLKEIEKIQIQINCLNGKHEYIDGVCEHCEYVCTHEIKHANISYVWSEDHFKCTGTHKCNTCEIVIAETVTPVLDTIADEDNSYYVRANFETISLEEQSLLSYKISEGKYLVYDSHGLYAWNNAAQVNPSISAEVHANITLPTDNITVTDGIPSSSNWTPVGSQDNPFTGSFFGNNSKNMGIDFIISGLRISEDNYTGLGFIGYNLGNVEYLKLEDAYVYGNNTDVNYIGSGVGVNLADGLVSNSYTFSSKVTAKNGTNNYAGGVVGYNQGGKIQGSWASADIISDEVAGGVVGVSSNDSSLIIGCYHVGTVIGKVNAGGVCGSANQSKIVGCYHIGTVNGEGLIGGIVAGKNLNSGAANYWQDTNATTANSIYNEYAKQVTDGNWLAILSQFNAEIDTWADSNSGISLPEYRENEDFEDIPFSVIMQAVVSGGKKK